MTRAQATSKARKLAKATGLLFFVVWAGHEDGMDPYAGYQPCNEWDVDGFFAGCKVVDLICR